MLDKYIENLKEEIINKTQELIQIPSVYSDSNNPNMPFGENANKALEYFLNLGKNLGFRTKNVDGYCGYIEFGEGEEMLGIIGHLDVVPEGTGWAFPPFSGQIANNRIYGRGAIDDKGPMISSLYAMKAVMENCKLSKRVRLIFGLNEELNWDCIKHYKKYEELPTISFSPDADFPCIYAEKAVLSCYLKMDYSNFKTQNIIIKNIDCNNNALNVVPKICSTVLEIGSISMDELILNLKNIITNYNFEIDIYIIDEHHLKLTSYGIGAHAAHPNLGINAISRLLVILYEIFNFYKIRLELLDFFYKYINTDFDGKRLGINFIDESGMLTLNVGKFVLENNFLKIGLNLRIPVNTPIVKIGNSFLKYTSSYLNIDFDTTNYQEALYIPKDNLLVQTLCKIFNEKTNSNYEPIAIGGATFSRAFKNCVSFGPNFPGNKDMCHQTDEFIDIDNLILMTKIYAEAIYFLGK